ncbi:hypothetical protein JMJ55_25835 [Belnapia sp. T6]|uniref:Uncharacterized protein n=1 Tax=Belnapia mucosa TaxID=2804532 RepID=A0ABS1VAR5_9PROT|nr:hypothetical protein [Belnapia mucosa]
MLFAMFAASFARARRDAQLQRLVGAHDLGAHRPNAREGLHEAVRQPDQHRGLESNDRAMQPDAAEIGPAWEDRGRNDEIQHQMVQCDGHRGDHHHPPVASADQRGERGKEVHMHVHLPRVPREQIDEERRLPD